MGFGKSFLLSLTAFVGLNFIVSILYFALDPGIDMLMDNIQNAPLMIIYYLFGAVTSVPFNNFDWAIVQPLFNEDTSFLILSLGYLVAPIIAAILAGRFAESKFQSFAGWLLTVTISTVMVIIGVFLSPTLELEFSNFFYNWTDFELILIYLIISCVINIVFYSFFALLVSKTEYY
ncbi:MAG: hypothetical protein ACFFG0_33305 [Candidatus Thorarchaeota archaeon]